LAPVQQLFEKHLKNRFKLFMQTTPSKRTSLEIEIEIEKEVGGGFSKQPLT